MNYDKTRRPVKVSEEDIQALAYFVDTHPERNEGIDLIKRLLTDYHEVRKAGILAKATNGQRHG